MKPESKMQFEDHLLVSSLFREIDLFLIFYYPKIIWKFHQLDTSIRSTLDYWVIAEYAHTEYDIFENGTRLTDVHYNTKPRKCLNTKEETIINFNMAKEILFKSYPTIKKSTQGKYLIKKLDGIEKILLGLKEPKLRKITKALIKHGWRLKTAQEYFDLIINPNRILSDMQFYTKEEFENQ